MTEKKRMKGMKLSNFGRTPSAQAGSPEEMPQPQADKSKVKKRPSTTMEDIATLNIKVTRSPLQQKSKIFATVLIQH